MRFFLIGGSSWKSAAVLKLELKLSTRTDRSQTRLLLCLLLLFLVLLLFAFLCRRLLQLLRVLKEQRVSEAGAQEQVAGLHGYHLKEGKRTMIGEFYLQILIETILPVFLVFDAISAASI